MKTETETAIEALAAVFFAINLGTVLEHFDTLAAAARIAPEKVPQVRAAIEAMRDGGQRLN